jgi:lysophospholipase L1-like esterase
MTRLTRAVAPLLVALVVLAGTLAGTAPAGAQQPAPGTPPRKVLVVGDSVILGAQNQMTQGFAGKGWSVVFDASVSRSTSAGAQAVAARKADATDALVVNLGANDAGNANLYAQRVEQVLAAAAGVPRVYWLTIREVRPYYPAANNVLREAAKRHPNLTVVDWNAASTAPGLTSSDGLHLKPQGAVAMTDAVLAAVQQNESTTTTTTTTTSTTTTVPPTTAAPTTTAAPSTTTTTSEPKNAVDTKVADDAGGMPKGTGELGGGPYVGIGMGLLVAGLLLCGAFAALRSAARKRAASRPAPEPVEEPLVEPEPEPEPVPEPEPAPEPDLSRAEQRAARIAAARAEHLEAAEHVEPPEQPLS